MTLSDDERFMRRALELAETGAEAGEVPVGAVLVQHGEIIGEGWNCPIGTHDPTAHAEIRALRDAAQRAGNYRLPGTTLYVTLEPCPMCAGALVHARVARVVYATREPKGGAAVSTQQFFTMPHLNHQVETAEGPCSDEASTLLKTFFSKRRARPE